MARGKKEEKGEYTKRKKRRVRSGMTHDRLNDGGWEARGNQLRRGVVETCFGLAGARKGVDLTGGAHLAAT
jgi:hypothetical protein